MKDLKLTFHPLTPERWKDFEKLFGERGACGGCWCMTWLLTKRDFDANKGNGNKKKMKALVNKNMEPGLLAYLNKEAIGWAAIAPRENYIRLENSKVLKRIDEQPVWSIPCFFIKKEFRKKGLSSEILKGAIKYCKTKGVKILEGYPVVPYSENMPAAFAWTGFPSAFIKAGFKEVARRSRTRPIMRIEIK
ncbi:MAG TPA: GNAT family N-acetyltransferase [Ignavibacteriaceae bacterium]|nr:GNAT family N-acetyltransferase [Ignavibacteriaceae bacterium]